ncbi:MAG: tRNA-dihydrouridine synthase, partial [Thermodesulfobacteriota bacterium]|nr:tRNA-dihydrouridine synthase [Thermodesulfobacteriota bacterium]
MKIGTLTLDNPLVLAPMAGITQLPLRLLAKEAGCALVVTEMVSSNGLIHRGQKTLELLRSHPAERP